MANRPEGSQKKGLKSHGSDQQADWPVRNRDKVNTFVLVLFHVRVSHTGHPGTLASLAVVLKRKKNFYETFEERGEIRNIL